jgi:Trypsin-co-occurring domain 1
MTDIEVEVVPKNAAEMALGARQLEKFSERAGDIADTLDVVAKSMRARLHSLAEQAAEGWDLDEVALAFSLDLKAGADVLIARASAGAGFQATLTWRRTRSAQG